MPTQTPQDRCVDHDRIQADIWRTERLLTRLGRTTSLSILHLDPPEPDVAVETADGLIGIELTELNPKGQLSRKHEEEEEKVTETARELYDAAGLPPLEVKVCWSGHWGEGTMTRARRTARAKGLKEFVCRHSPEGNSPVFLDADQQAGIDFPEGVHYVSMMRLPDPPSFWGCPRLDWPPGVAVEEVRRAMAKKNGKVRGYRGQYREIWLLMVIGASGPATWGMITGTLRSTRFVSRFHRAFVLGLMDGGFVELDVGYTPASESP